MEMKLMREFEELEGLTDQNFEGEDFDDKAEDDESFRPALAASLQSSEIFVEMEHRGLKSTGFPDTDREILQKAFDEEFKNSLEEARAKRRENRRRAAQQAGLQKRRMLMERTLQEEQDELARNHQVAMMIELIKDNMVKGSIRMDVNSVSARSLAKSMWANTTITCLDLSSNQLNDHSGAYLARILKKNSTLKKIELDNNILGPQSCAAFGHSLKVNSSLIFLSLDSNPIAADGDLTGIKTLSDAIRSNSTLTTLNLWRTGITSEGGTVLANCVEENDSLLFCDIGHNTIDMSDVKRIAEKLDRNLAEFEASERIRRERAVTDEERQRRRRDADEAEQKQKDLAKWLEDRRDERAENRRLKEEQRLAEAIAEMAEKKRLADEEKERERKAAEEAAAKKAKKKDKGKKK